MTAMPIRARLREIFRLALAQPRHPSGRGGVTARRGLPLLGAAVITVALVVSPAAPGASAAPSPAAPSPVAVAVTANPAPVAAGQAFSYTITAANTGAAAASVGISASSVLAAVSSARAMSV